MSSLSFPRDFISRLLVRKSFKSKSKFPKISIVMPCYNQVKYLERSILSVVNQNYPNIELIIIDGGSNDGSVKIIKKYKKFIKYWSSKKDNGQSHALNKGFLKATGDIYGFLNSDDLYLPNIFNLVAIFFLKYETKKVIFGDWLSINKQDKIIDFNYAFDFNLNHLKYEGFHLNTQAMFWRSSVHEEFNGFDEMLQFTMDYQMLIEFGIKQGQRSFLRIPHTLSAFRRYKGQKTSGMNSEVVEEHKRIARQYNFLNKYLMIGTIIRLSFRFRRCLWYLKRGGLYYLFKKLNDWLRK